MKKTCSIIAVSVLGIIIVVLIIFAITYTIMLASYSNYVRSADSTGNKILLTFEGKRHFGGVFILDGKLKATASRRFKGKIEDGSILIENSKYNILLEVINDIKIRKRSNSILLRQLPRDRILSLDISSELIDLLKSNEAFVVYTRNGQQYDLVEICF